MLSCESGPPCSAFDLFEAMLVGGIHYAIPSSDVQAERAM